MRKKLIIFILLAWLPLAGSAFGQTSLNLGVGFGDNDSMAYDLFVQHDFNPWLESECWELSPFLTGGLTIWDDDDSSDSVWGVLAAFGLSLSYTGFDNVRPYLSLNGGPSYVSQKNFVGRDLGGHYLFNSRAMLGLKFGQELQHNIGVHGSHYSIGQSPVPSTHLTLPPKAHV